MENNNQYASSQISHIFLSQTEINNVNLTFVRLELGWVNQKMEYHSSVST